MIHNLDERMKASILCSQFLGSICRNFFVLFSTGRLRQVSLHSMHISIWANTFNKYRRECPAFEIQFQKKKSSKKYIRSSIDIKCGSLINMYINLSLSLFNTYYISHFSTTKQCIHYIFMCMAFASFYPFHFAGTKPFFPEFHSVMFF